MPRLRLDLDFLPSPTPERPGLLLRDPAGYSPAVLIVPPLLAQALQFLDGVHTERDLRSFLVEATGDLTAGEAAKHLIAKLDEAYFLDNSRFAERRAECHREFAESPVRQPSHLGPGGYPADRAELHEVFAGYFRGPYPPPDDNITAIAAPHVSPFGGWESYAAAYAAIPRSAASKTFVILGTSHYGEPESFGLTRKPFRSPYGDTRVASHLVDELERHGGEGVRMEDYCHAREHSIEFQVVFLQHLFGPEVSILPILCGPFANSLYRGGAPEEDGRVAQFLNALGELQAKYGSQLFWVLGVDMAHMGRRYGDPWMARPNEGEMKAIAAQDRQRIGAIESADPSRYWDLIQQDQDPLKWCGSAPFYAFLRASPGCAGSLNSYEQWGIDEESVVTFAGMTFRKTPG